MDGLRHVVTIEVSIINMGTLDLVNAVAIALANSPDLGSPNVRVHRIEVEEADA